MVMFTPLWTTLTNVLIYQLGWFSCVLGGAWGHPVPGALTALGLAAVHLVLAENVRAEIRLMGMACILGVTVDSLQQYFGVFTFTSHPSWPVWLPLWVFVIWAQFATLFRFALAWMQGRYLLAAFFGMVGGPLAYVSGIKLGAASFGSNPTLSILVLAAVWACVTPFLLWLSQRGGFQPGRYRWPG